MLHSAAAHLTAHHAATLLAAHHAALHAQQVCQCNGWGAIWSICTARQVGCWLRMPADSALRMVGASEMTCASR